MEIPVALTWFGIALCVIQSGSFSGLNLALFGVSALRLEAQSAAGDADARRLLELRRDSNFLLSTVLWGNVGTNVLLTLLTDSVLAGALGLFRSLDAPAGHSFCHWGAVWAGPPAPPPQPPCHKGPLQTKKLATASKGAAGDERVGQMARRIFGHDRTQQVFTVTTVTF